MRHKTLCWIYGLLAFAALIATWSQNIRHMLQDDGNGPLDFVEDMYANPAASSIANDLVFMALAAIVLMVVESRRLGIRRVWVYVALSFVTAISVTFPLFLLARERRLAQLEAGSAPT